ncbi:MAG: hypothetical protein EBT57_05620, partial [Verrucomicrobia bacterium]|nr:hypothetical protein [Verrucomicrobiota bacterium]
SASSSIKLTINTSKAYSSSGTKPADSYDGKTSTRWSSSISSKDPNTNGEVYGKDVTAIIYDLGENKTLSSMKLNWYNGNGRTDNYRLDSATNTNVWTTYSWNTNGWTTVLGRTNSQTTNLTNGYETVNFSNNASGRYVRLVSWGNSTLNGFTGIIEVEFYGSTYVAPDTRAEQSIIFGALDSPMESDPPMALAAYSLSSSNTLTGLPIAYESSDSTVATVDGSTLTIAGSGSAWITASQSGGTNSLGIVYKPAPQVQQLLTVTAVTPGITSPGSATAVRGLPFRYQITAVRSPTNYSASGLPAGLTVEPISGKISGTPTVAGSFNVTLSADNSAGTGTGPLALNVVEPYVYETFESYTNGQVVPTTTAASGIKASRFITNAAGINTIGGTNGKVAWYNAPGSGTSGYLEFNAGSAGQSYLAASFELFHNAAPSTSTSQPLAISLAGWNPTNTAVGGNNGRKMASLEFNQFESTTMPSWFIKTNNVTVKSSTYNVLAKQTVHLFANDHDTSTINYVGPDGNVRTLATNSFAVFLNGIFIGSYGLNLTAVDNSSPAVLLAGNTNLGRLCFNTGSTTPGNWLIDNVVISDLPTDVLVPAPSAPLITSTNAVTSQGGGSFAYQTTTTELADSFVCDGLLPTGLSFNTTNGLISGAPNQSGVFPMTIYAVNSAGSGLIDLTLTITPAPPNIFTGTDPSLNTGGSWSLGSGPTSSSAGGSYADLVFSSASTNLTTSSGNINGKSMNVTNGSNYTLSSVRTTAGSATTYKIGNTWATDSSPFTNLVTGITNELVFLTNSSSLTLSPASPSNNIPAILELHNSGTMRIETGSTLNIPCAITESPAGSGFLLNKRGGGKLILSGANSYTGLTTVEAGTLALSGSGTAPVTMKTGSVLEVSMTNPASILGAGLTLEMGSQVRIIGSPSNGLTYTLATASAVTNNATLETSIPGYQLAVSGNSLVLMPSALVTPTITWSNPVAITYGTALSSTQLNAASSAAGGFTYSPTNGTVLPVGTNTLTAIFTATDTNSYVSPVTNTVSLVVNKATPSITSPPTASAITYGQTLASSTLTGGEGSVAGSFTFTTPSTAPSAGTANQSVTFTPTDSASYNPASTTVSVTVNKATPSITWSTPAPISFGTTLSATQLNASSSVAGSFTYNPTNGAVLPAGTNTLTAVFTAADTNNHVSPLTNSVSLVVNAAIVSSNAALANLTLSSGTLSPSFSSGTTNYTATVSNLLSIRVTPSLADSNGTVNVNGINVASGTPSGKIRLLPGTNTVTVLATAQDGSTTRTYTLQISQNDEFDGLRARWQATLVSNGASSSLGSKAYGFWKTNAASLNTNANSSSVGLWSDLPILTNSISTATASGNMVTSFSRLYKMALAYTTPGCTASGVTLTGNTELAGSIVNALDWMVANVYKTSGAFYGNWFDWEVQGAQYFADTQTLMYALLSEDQLLQYAAAIDNYGPNSA